MSPRHNLSFCAYKTAWFAPEWQVYMGSSLHLCFFKMQNSDFMTRLTRLYGAQTSSIVFAWKPATFGPKLHVSMVPWTHLWFSVCKTPCLASELLVSMGPSPHLWFLHSKQRLLESNNKSLWFPDITCRFVHAKQRDLHQNDKSIWVPAFICVFFNAKQRLYDQTYKTAWGPDLIYCFCMSLWFLELTCDFLHAKHRA